MKIAKITRSILERLQTAPTDKVEPPYGPSSTAHYCMLLNSKETFSLGKVELSRVFLSKSNVNALLSKLNRVRNGESSHCTLIKRDTIHPLYPCTYETAVTAVEDTTRIDDIAFLIYVVDDSNYYAERSAGEIHPKDM